MIPRKPLTAALILAAHGDRGEGGARNRWLFAHAETLRAGGPWRTVHVGMLKGAPSLEEALRAAAATSARILLYPLFMGDGYFMGKLRERLLAADADGAVALLPPLGADPRLPALMHARALEAAATAGFDARRARLLVAAHGSQVARANAQAAGRVCAALARRGGFAGVDCAYLEEPPFLRDALAAEPEPTVVAGFFSGEGMHAQGDVPEAIAATGARAVYTGAIGADPAVCDLIRAAARAGTGLKTA